MFQTFAAMGETSESPSVTEEGELSNDGDTNDLFVVDSTPRVNENRIEIPVYNKKFNEVLQVQPKEDGNDKPKRAKPAQNKCWNCDGDHSLRDCTEPRNYEAINRNRQLFMSKSTPRGSKASRYHLDDQQKYPHVQPGRMSRRLRRALGLQSNQLPRHIYRMRILGYPPGWVEEARVSHSGLYLFNSDGQEVADPGFEDGEVVAAGAKDKFDTKKIIEYPGFNCPCGPDIIDETERLNSKPMAEKDSIERMMVVWQPKAVTAYKRRKMNAADSSGTPKPSDHAKKRSLLLLDDMEIESDGAGSSGDDGEIDEEKKEDVQDTKPASPEAQKRSASPTSDLPSPKRQRTDGSENSQDSVKSNVSSQEENRQVESPSIPATPSVGKVTSVTLGTPVIVTSPYLNLPSSEKFSKDICDVINFENLPDSTGKYEKMSGLIKKVRTFVTKLNSEEDDE